MVTISKFSIILCFFAFMSCTDTVRVQTPGNIGTMEVEQKPGDNQGLEAGEEVSSNECIEEFCDGLDNDCDGVPDEELICSCGEDNSCYGGPPITQNIGTCQNGTRMCGSNGEVWQECEAWTPPTDEVCDELDNDCDGIIDEGTDNACGICGELPEEVCDGVDNDCDSLIDEGTLNACERCGDVPEEICDESDNDCDGAVDEGVTNACGSCGALPEEICDEIDNNCNGEVDEGCRMCDPTNEVCDGQDNDCDGQVDESVLNACGVCGAVDNETCDGQDNDCDGQVDEGVLNACGVCGDTAAEVCDRRDNDCDGQVDERVLNACGACGAVPQEVCDNSDNDCDGQTDEGVRNACNTCGAVPQEVCDGQDNDCDGQTDEGVLNACGECGDAPREVCDLVDNDCDGVVDERGCVVTDIDLNGDCLTVSCPDRAPHPIACDVRFRGDDPRGCVAYNPGESSVYFQEGNDCGAGRVRGTLTCSNIQLGRLNEMNCPMNKRDTSYPRRRRGCADTD